MKFMKPSLVSYAILLGLLMAGCSANPAVGPSGPQGPPGPQGASDHDRDRDRDRDRDADPARRDQAASCPGGEHRDAVGGCIRD
jgi:hypothetical protein